jgi:hypothetical protein
MEKVVADISYLEIMAYLSTVGILYRNKVRKSSYSFSRFWKKYIRLKLTIKGKKYKKSVNICSKKNIKDLFLQYLKFS